MKKNLFTVVFGILIVLLLLGIIEASNIEGETNQLSPAEKGPMLKSAGNTQLNWTEGVDFYTISIAKPEGVTDEGPDGFTIMDRNLGATTNEVDTTYGSYTNGTGSYGYHYQWGNNYGFAQGCTITGQWLSCSDGVVLDTNGIPRDSGYNNSGYYSTNFINGSNIDFDVRNDSSHHNGLRGGAGDNAGNNWGANEDNPADRQGPCPIGYHVPSAGEWGLLIKYWAYASGYDVNGSEGLYYISDETVRIHFMNYFKLPFAGSRLYGDAYLYKQGSIGYYWSSSPDSVSSDSARYLYQGGYKVDASSKTSRANGFSVRCFKNTYNAPVHQTHTLTFLDDGVKVRTGKVVDDESWTGDISAPNGKRGYKFDYRYADGGDNTTTGFDFNTPITGNIILHAHWTLVQSLPNGIVTNEDGSKTIVRGDTVLTVAGEDLGTYEWGTTSIGHSYSSDNNAWGGSGDNGENGYDNGKERYKRQGPCDTGWHIPSAGERSSLIISWCNLTEDCEIVYDFNGFPSINNYSMLQKFIEELNLLNEKRYRASSPYYYVWLLGSIYIQDQSNGTNSYEVRCFKNYITVPQIFEVTFIDEGRYIWSGDILSGDKVPSEIISQKNLTGLTKEGYTFSGWVISGSNEKFDVENGIVITGMILNAMRDKNQYTIRFDTDGGNNINSITAYYGDNITVPADPTKNGYRFIRREPEIPTTIPSKNLTVKAIWEKIGSSGGGGGSSNGGSSSKSQTTNSLSSSKSETTNNLSLSIGNKNPDINERIEIIIDTDEKYTGIVNFTKMQYYSEGKWMNISMTSKNYVSDYSDEVEAGYIRFSSSDKGRIKISKFIKISQKGNYRIYVEDKDGNKDYVEFRVGNGENINNDTEEEVYISRSCKKYIIKYDEELGVFTSPNLLKKEYFINKEYFKRYIDSKNKQIDGCPTNKWNLVRYKDNSNNTDRHVAPNGKVYFIEGQQGRFYSNEINKELNRLTSFSTIQELKNYIMGRNPITPIVNK